ncbi:MAG: DUF1622 domain-containing protein [Actinomycetota bacterium]|nr:DUF1622 domain-containing protein [Actinomycetota bacterium]
METYHAAVDLLRVFALAVGSLVILAGVWHGALAARGPGGRMLDHAALGLDFFVGATLLNLAINPTWTAVATTAVTIVVRKLLTYALGREPRVPSATPATGPGRRRRGSWG